MLFPKYHHVLYEPKKGRCPPSMELGWVWRWEHMQPKAGEMPKYEKLKVPGSRYDGFRPFGHLSFYASYH